MKHFDEITRVFTSASQDLSNDFVEALMYSKTEAVVMTGRLTDDVERNKVLQPSSMIEFQYCHNALLPS